MCVSPDPYVEAEPPTGWWHEQLGLGREGGALTKGIRLLVKGTPESSVRPPARRRYSEQTPHVNQEGSSQNLLLP